MFWGFTYLPLQVGGLVWAGPGQHSGVTEACSQERPQHKQKQHTSYDRDDWSQLLRQERTTVGQGEVMRKR